MYNVSEKYLEQILKPAQQFCLKGKIGERDITDRNILSGSLGICNQCSKKNEVAIGSVYIGEFKATFVNVADIYSWEKKVITLNEGLIFDDGTIEYVPFTPYTVSSADDTECGIEIVAYDNMAKFDKSFDTDTLTDTPYGMLKYSCEVCGVELGMTEKEVMAFPNGSAIMILHEENDIETHRDFLSWIAQSLAAFATIDRQGKLVFRRYTQEENNTIDNYHRLSGGRFSKFQTKYTGISCVNISESTTSYYGLEVDDGLTYNLGSNPLLQYGVSTGTRDTMRKAVLEGIQDINYVPFEVSLLNGALYDLGDVILFTEGIASGKKSCVMYYNYMYDRAYDIKGFGSDPALANAKSKTDKNLVGLANQKNDNEIQYYTFINLEPIDIGDGSSAPIIDIRFTSNKAGFAVFQAQVLVEAESAVSEDVYNDIVAKITYLINGEEIDIFHPTETWVDGKHILNLFYVISVDAGVLSEWSVLLSMYGGSCHIDEYDIRASIYGQSLAASDQWDGTLKFKETVGDIPFKMEFIPESFRATTDTMLNDYYDNNLTDSIPDIPFGMNLCIEDMSEELEVIAQ